MKVYITGIEGYIGWALAQYLLEKGHSVFGCDNYSREKLVRKYGSDSAIPISKGARAAFLNVRRQDLATEQGGAWFCKELKRVRPDVVINLAQNPSAPYSMMSRQAGLQVADNVAQVTNVLWAMRNADVEHLVHIGSMGEYGTPECAIPEGMFTHTDSAGNLAELLFPRKPASFYHASKVGATFMIEAACRFWGIKATDIMQGVVYGTRVPGMELPTRFDFDHLFGTAINRFVAQAIAGEPLTVYGAGTQIRGFLPLCDSVRCLELLMENEPESGVYRTANQFAQPYSIIDLAKEVCDSAQKTLKIEPVILPIENPRVEAADHLYEPEMKVLPELGYEPTLQMDGVLGEMFEDLAPHSDRIKRFKKSVMPKVNWRR